MQRQNTGLEWDTAYTIFIWKFMVSILHSLCQFNSIVYHTRTILLTIARLILHIYSNNGTIEVYILSLAFSFRQKFTSLVLRTACNSNN